MSLQDFEKVGVLTERIDQLMVRLDRFEELAEKRFVTRLEFSPVQRLVFGLVGLLLSLMVTTLAGVVLVRWR